MFGYEIMTMHGFPRVFLDEVLGRADISDATMRDLAGNSFTSGPLLAVFIAVLLHWPCGIDAIPTSPERAGPVTDECIFSMPGCSKSSI